MSRTDRASRIALGRIDVLMQEAERAALDGDLDRAHRYARRARDVGMRHNVPVPREHKPFVCRECGAYLLPGETSRVRLRGKRVSRTCLECGDIRRVPFHREVARRRRR